MPSGVETIGEDAFEDNLLNGELDLSVFPNLKKISDEAFAYNQLTSVEIPNSVTSIEDYAFDDNQLTGVTIKGKSSTSDFTYYGSNVFGWASGYSDANITFIP